MVYWKNKEQMARKAQRHTNVMELGFSKNIQECVHDTVIYSDTVTSNNEAVPESSCSRDHKIILDDLDSVSAIFKYVEGKTAVLNFASFKNPGGMFLRGSSAQEESLCHASFLYNVLSQFAIKFYGWNNHHKNKALYHNRALYTPHVRFFSLDKARDCDVITCAAPNKTVAQRYQQVSDKENSAALKSRISFVLDIANAQRVDTLILGAFGCGVFGQDATEVATIFRDCMQEKTNYFSKVVFAIPFGNGGNYEKFQKVLLHRQ